MNAARGMSDKPDPKKTVGGSIAVALIAGVLLIMALTAIYRAWPN